MEGNAPGPSQVALSDGSTVEVDVVVVALGSVRNVEWLARLAPGGRPAGRRRRRRLPGDQQRRPRHRRRVRRRRCRPVPPSAVRVPVPQPWSTGRTPSPRREIVAHNMVCTAMDRCHTSPCRRSGRSSSASTSSRSASRRSATDLIHAGLGGGPQPVAAYGRRRSPGRSRHVRPGEVARLLPAPDRVGGTFPLDLPGRRQSPRPTDRSRSKFPHPSVRTTRPLS